MLFTGAGPEYSVEDCLNAATANLILNVGPEPIITPLHQNWIHRRTALIQTTLDGAAQNWFSVLPIDIKSDWKRFTQEISKIFDSERNKQHQRVLCNEIRRLPNETIKQLAVRIETLVGKAYSLNTHDYKNAKMTKILMMILTPQLRKIAIKKRASHPSSIREPDLEFRFRKSDWKRFTQEISKIFDSERNKQHQRVLCNEIRRLPNETIKQLAVRIETLVGKAYSLNTHDYKNAKMTKTLMMILTPQLRKIAIKKRASHPSSIGEPDLEFRKLVDKLELAEITMKLEETENLKLHYGNQIKTNTTHINNTQGSDTDLIEKITEILKIYEKNPNFKGKPSFKKWCNYCRRYGHSIAESRQKQQDNQNKPQKHKEPNKSFYQYMKKDQNLPNKNIYSNNSSGKPQATQISQ